MITSPADVTQLLVKWSDGDQSALDELLPLVNDELRRLARGYLWREQPGHTLQPTALVNEAYLRLIDQQHVHWQNRAHFFGIAAQLMRRILIDHARRYQYAKRGGGALRVSLDETAMVTEAQTAELLAVNEALEKLTAMDARKGHIVELRFFGGLSLDEVAEVMKISSPTVQREWRAAKAWLHRILTEGNNDACNLAPSERVAFLSQACVGDEALRREVELLLASDEQAGTLIEAPAIQLVAPLFAESAPPSLAGKFISHYEILSLVGKGGMGEVYCARDTKLDRTIALKILPSDVAMDAERMHRFVREAKAASALNHPHVATIYEIGEADGVSFIAMEYVEGQTLAAKINGQPVAINEIVAIGCQIADALDESHSKGITHRDIKPANVMLTTREQVKVLDFGLAKIVRPVTNPAPSDISTMPKSEPGIVMGTMPYLSPEQALGHEVDHRSDIFSLGVVLYEMATGRLPFAGASTSEMLDRILHAPPEAIARFNYDVPAELERIVNKALRKDREQRYQSGKDLLIDLKDLQHQLEFATDLGAQAARLRSERSDATGVASEYSEQKMILSQRGRAACAPRLERKSLCVSTISATRCLLCSQFFHLYSRNSRRSRRSTAQARCMSRKLKTGGCRNWQCDNEGTVRGAVATR